VGALCRLPDYAELASDIGRGGGFGRLVLGIIRAR
jgi:hypothetical protein